MATIPGDVKVGTKVWIRERQPRQARSFEDVMRQWRERVIVSETRVSWNVAYREGWSPDLKINKKTGEANDGSMIRWTLDGLREEWEEAGWRAAHGYKIADALRHVDTATLRKVAELIGYQESAQ